MALLLWLEPRLAHDTSADMRAVFWAQAFLMGVGLLVFGLPWAALAAFLAMSLVGTLAERVPSLKRQLG